MTDISLCWNDLRWPLRTATDDVVSVLIRDLIPSPAYVTAVSTFGWSPVASTLASVNEQHLTIVRST